MDILKILEEAEEIFFIAMINGYANPNKQEIKIFDPCITFPPEARLGVYLQNDRFILIDYFFTSPVSTQSFGQTIIYYKDNGGILPIWRMQYGGWHQKEAIPFLKEVLFSTYQKKEFWGGRGKSPCQKGNFLYINKPERNTFENFKGREEISGGNGSLLEVYEYQGGFLFP